MALAESIEDAFAACLCVCTPRRAACPGPRFIVWSFQVALHRAPYCTERRVPVALALAEFAEFLPWSSSCSVNHRCLVTVVFTPRVQAVSWRASWRCAGVSSRDLCARGPSPSSYRDASALCTQACSCMVGGGRPDALAAGRCRHTQGWQPMSPYVVPVSPLPCVLATHPTCTQHAAWNMWHSILASVCALKEVADDAPHAGCVATHMQVFWSLCSAWC